MLLAKPGFWPRAALAPSWLCHRATPGVPQPHLVRTKCPKELSRHCWKLDPTSPVGPQLHCSRGQRSKLRIQPGPWHETKCLGLQKFPRKLVCLNYALVKPPCPGFSQRGCKGKTAWAAGIHVCNTCDIPLRISFLQGL